MRLVAHRHPAESEGVGRRKQAMNSLERLPFVKGSDCQKSGLPPETVKLCGCAKQVGIHAHGTLRPFAALH
jgi:hypothetical protein